MTKFKFIHAADIHLDSPLRGLARYEGAPVEEIRGATRQAFDHLIHLAITEAVDFVLLAGDLYDGDWKDYNTGLYFIRCMSRLEKNNIRVFLISGNHDAVSQITRSLHLPKNVHHFSAKKAETVVLNHLDIAVHGQSFAKRVMDKNLAEHYPNAKTDYFNIGILHTSLTGRPGHEPYAPCSLDDLRLKNYQYWALGHVHKREVVSKNPWVIFSGNIQGRHIREIGAKGCTLVKVENHHIVSVQHKILDVLRWQVCQVSVEGCETAEMVYDKVEDAFQKLIHQADNQQFLAIRLIIRGACNAHTELHANSEHWTARFRSLATDLGDDKIWLEKIQLNTQVVLDLETALQREDALGILLNNLQAMKLEPATFKTIIDEEFKKIKLPEAYWKTEAHFNPQNQEHLQELLENTQAYLISHLLRGA